VLLLSSKQVSSIKLQWISSNLLYALLTLTVEETRIKCINSISTSISMHHR